MTTMAMIFGMLPLAFEIGAGSEMRAPMARAVIGGLITSTILTLIAVPVVYSLLDDLTQKLFKKSCLMLLMRRSVLWIADYRFQITDCVSQPESHYL